MAESDPPSAADVPPAAGAVRARRVANAFIALFLAYQVATPLSYYASERVYDERFGWRMFSTVRLQQCELRVEEVPANDGIARPVALGGTLHIAWINLLKRGWPRVIARYLGDHCASEKVAEVRLERRCRGTDGTELPPERFALACGTDHVRTGEAAK